MSWRLDCREVGTEVGDESGGHGREGRVTTSVAASLVPLSKGQSKSLRAELAVWNLGV